MEKKMCLAMFSGSLDRLTAAGVVISGAAVDDMEIEIYVLLMGARAFKKENATDVSKFELSEYPTLKEDFLNSAKQLNVKPWLEFFKEAKELTNVKIHICGLAGKLWGGEELGDFVDIADDICGINEYITSAQEADINLFI